MKPSPRGRGATFVNHARTVRTRPAGWRTPSSEDEIVRCVAEAAGAGQRLRAVGAGHSWSPIAAPDGVALSLDRWHGVVGRGAGWVRVRAGTRLCDLNRALSGWAEALPILGSVTGQSVAGAIATGTHGSSLTHGNLSSLVLAARLVTAAGRSLELGPDDERLDAVRVHLGALGVVSEVTLRTVPAFRLAETVEQLPVERVAARVEALGRSAEYVKVWWLPHTPAALVMRAERTAAAPTRRPSPATRRMIDNGVANRVVMPLVVAWHDRRPEAVPRFNALASRVLARRGGVGPSTLVLTTPDPVRHHETEAAVPLAAGGEAFERTVRLIDHLGLRVNFIVELRYVRGDTGWMSPAQGGDVVHLGAYTAMGARRQYFDAFWREMRPLAGRPHWGKEMDHDGEEIRSLYPMAERFVALRDDLDPRRMFTNGFLERVLG